jgi:hypothetical protein
LPYLVYGFWGAIGIRVESKRQKVESRAPERRIRNQKTDPNLVFYQVSEKMKFALGTYVELQRFCYQQNTSWAE